jgi:hypothetical protein
LNEKKAKDQVVFLTFLLAQKKSNQRKTSAEKKMLITCFVSGREMNSPRKVVSGSISRFILPLRKLSFRIFFNAGNMESG